MYTFFELCTIQVWGEPAGATADEPRAKDLPTPPSLSFDSTLYSFNTSARSSHRADSECFFFNLVNALSTLSVYFISGMEVWVR